jgi:hypothetical protein
MSHQDIGEARRDSKGQGTTREERKAETDCKADERSAPI